MAKKKIQIPENETYILPSSDEELLIFTKKFKLDMTEHIVSSIEYAVEHKLPLVELFQFKKSDYVITISEKEYKENIEHIYEFYNDCKLYELCPRIEKIRELLKSKL